MATAALLKKMDVASCTEKKNEALPSMKRKSVFSKNISFGERRYISTVSVI
jgi:hypothetical protein